MKKILKRLAYVLLYPTVVIVVITCVVALIITSLMDTIFWIVTGKHPCGWIFGKMVSAVDEITDLREEIGRDL